MEEIFKDILGYEDYYQVSNLGKVIKKDRYETINSKTKGKYKRFRKGGEIYVSKTKRKTGGYLLVCLRKDGKVKSKLIHRLVAQCFIENKYNKPCVNHIDGNKHNNYINNLEWVTYSENELHSFKVLGKQVWNKGKSTVSRG